jgi:hypothetical protein
MSGSTRIGITDGRAQAIPADQPGAFARTIGRRLKSPAIAAPIFRVSDPDLVFAACKAGVIGALPSANCRDIAELDAWLSRISCADARRCTWCATLNPMGSLETQLLPQGRACHCCGLAASCMERTSRRWSKRRGHR